MTSETTSAALRRRAQLRDFLRACRARLTPADVGVVAVGRRRTPATPRTIRRSAGWSTS
ncbi:hypothetical protein [Goodfellowiella coeruleoviolacea]|uniref:hypothetical protein n=1 Tax=Goodfellowiella coeruleoviolacea TaxID=334858 RepID=UPI0020A25320|nr:hypothetical protein [Goodfellowiella coeruleoviolacea]